MHVALISFFYCGVFLYFHLGFGQSHHSLHLDARRHHKIGYPLQISREAESIYPRMEYTITEWYLGEKTISIPHRVKSSPQRIKTTGIRYY